MGLMEKLAKAGAETVHAAVLSDSTLFNEKDHIPTSVPIVNVALSGKLDGGISPGLLVLAGPSKHFKSNLGLIMINAYMKKYPDSICLFYDSEFGVTPEYISANGINPDRVLHIPVEHIEQLKFDISKRLEAIERGEKVIIFIDSVGNLASKKEVEDALDEKSVADMSRAKAMKSLFRIITPHLTTKDIPCIVVNHTYKEMACLKGDTKIKTISGIKEIKDIIVGDMVYAINGIKQVTHIFKPEDLMKENKKYMKLTFDDGSHVECTDNHEFLLDNNSWCAAGNLRIGEIFK